MTSRKRKVPVRQHPRRTPSGGKTMVSKHTRRLNSPIIKARTCTDCGKVHETDNEYYCPRCQEKANKRNEFRQSMSNMKQIADLQYPETLFMSGFSYAELEQFSLTLKKIIKKYHLPDEADDFVNPHAKKELQELQDATRWHWGSQKRS